MRVSAEDRMASERFERVARAIEQRAHRLMILDRRTLARRDVADRQTDGDDPQKLGPSSNELLNKNDLGSAGSFSASPSGNPAGR